MIRAEWKYLAKHKFMMIVMIAIIFIPSIYSVTFLQSMWDPYGMLNKIPVAVVNHDESTNYQGTNLAVGKDLSKTLKKSSAMDFEVVKSGSEASKGLANGKYYMAITIPKNFSKNATTLMKKNPKKMVLHYETSAGHNYIASKMTASAAKQVAQSVSEEVTKTYSKTMFASIKKLSNGMDTAAKGSNKLATGSEKLVSANNTMTSGLDTLSSSSLTFANGANTLNNGLNTYVQGVSSAANGSSTLATGLNQLNSSTSSLSSGVGQLSTGGKKLASGVQNYTSGVSQLNTAADSLNNGTSSLVSGAGTLATNANTLDSGLSQIATASDALTKQLEQVGNGSTSSSQLNDLSSSLTDLKSQLNENSTTKSSALKSDLESLQTEIDNQSQNQKDSIKSRVSAAADQKGLTADQKAAMLSAVEGTNDTSTTDTSALKKSANALSADIDSLSSTQATANNDITTVIAELAKNSAALTTQIQSASSGMNQLSQGIGQLSSNSQQLASGTGQISAGTSQLVSNNASLNNGANSLNSGLSSLNSQVPTLTGGVSQLATGATQLNSGLNTLSANNSTLTSGAGQLASGATQISSGADQLHSGSTQMGSGLGQVYDGSNDLSTQLANGAKESKINPSKLTYDQVAQPTKTTHTERDDAPNNGTGMTPYMLSVSLFIGALAFNLMFDMYTPRKYPHSGFAWWVSKASLMAGFVLAESIVVYILLKVIDGLAPIHPIATFFMVFFTGLVFMAIVSWLNLVAGKVGSFISMILLVLQLGASAGTYPIQLTNGFFQKLHPWLPMSYSVDGFRATLMIGSNALPQILVLVGITAVFGFLSFLFYTRRRSRIKEIDYTEEASKHSLV
ncbi:YhgE/Pip domain-containing protein [Companilactobacillus mishanensis]|uniref:YhgE/Pip domain-containing protein n=1 Tax=Companilactobacillus mishanensis TaxID=2486008 RepID=A0ABW9P610_9LACO|nr:YhgE/Pip domain-containing protein [Companilactobacillus mishanensis]MQS44639.1 YhgE/Pip domain-containing protein [Companilactobacillus mishanensis]